MIKIDFFEKCSDLLQLVQSCMALEGICNMLLRHTDVITQSLKLIMMILKKQKTCTDLQKLAQTCMAIEKTCKALLDNTNCFGRTWSEFYCFSREKADNNNNNDNNTKNPKKRAACSSLAKRYA